jgi:hypothetical protein
VSKASSPIKESRITRLDCSTCLNGPSALLLREMGFGERGPTVRNSLGASLSRKMLLGEPVARSKNLACKPLCKSTIRHSNWLLRDLKSPVNCHTGSPRPLAGLADTATTVFEIVANVAFQVSSLSSLTSPYRPTSHAVPAEENGD